MPDFLFFITQEIAGHKLSDVVIDRLPTLCTLTPGGRISYSEVIAFHNVVRGGCDYIVLITLTLTYTHVLQKWIWSSGQ